MVNLWCLVIAAVLGLVGADRDSLPPTCDSLIYCHGPLLHTVQMAGLYNDSKTFVDMKIKFSPNITLEHFRKMMERLYPMEPTKADIQEFVNQNFDPEGSEFEDWRPTDWKDNPAFLQRIKDPLLHQWASDLNRLWLELGRKMKEDVKKNQDLYSIIYVDNPVIVPGGRFREFYYWDSYWIIQGLLLSEMRSTARGMVSNFLDIVDRIGLIPNGGRIYYVMRFLMLRYADGSKGPRPESYKEDIDCAKHFDTTDKKEELYAELKAAAESGWDFSSRWFILNGTNKGNLTNLKTRSIIPVDLNAIMSWNAEIMADFYQHLGNVDKERYYRNTHARLMEAIEKVLWHEDVGVWLDFSLESKRRRDYFYPSNVAPLWTGSYDKARTEYFVRRVINYLDKVKVDIYEGGIPTTFEHSGEQWDYPNAWPPLQYIVVTGLANTKLPEATRLAYEMATKWVRSNFEVWKQKTAMLEKYDATIFGGYGGGGEYVLQTGFGWTNGVVMALLNRYGERLSSAEAFGSDAVDGAVHGAAVGASGVATAVLVVMASVAAGALGLMVYWKRKDYITLTGGEDLKLLSRRPYTELRSMNGSSNQRQR
ncbi:Trehalase [Papilio xuthus]|uniref:Trehalase n=1 Tax=Papilio xuthus TaxID=66420 RepID=A0A0N0PA61_PAPXU|nr:Trehalase [Papilio xuthus]